MSATIIGYAGPWPFRHILDVPLRNRLSHMLVVGMTGAGKTTTLKSIISQDVAAGHSVIVIDGKGDPSIVGSLLHRHPWMLFGSEVEGTLSFNPLLGNPDQVVSAFTDACGFENEFYRGCAARLLGAYLHLCSGSNPRRVPNIRELAGLAINLKSLVSNIDLLEGQPHLSVTFEALQALNASSYMQHHAGLANRLDLLVNSNWADHLCSVNAGDKPQIDFEQAFEKPGLLYIGLQKLANRQGANQLGRMLLARIGNLAADRARLARHGALESKPIVSVVVDELAGIAYPGFETLPQTVRSSQVMLTLATQTLSDLRAVSKDFATQIQTNTGVKIIHQQNSDTDADTWSKHIGTRLGSAKLFDRFLETINPRGFPKERRFIAEPDDLKNLRPGYAFVEQMGNRKKKQKFVRVIALTDDAPKSKEAA